MMLSGMSPPALIGLQKALKSCSQKWLLKLFGEFTPERKRTENIKMQFPHPPSSIKDECRMQSLSL